MSREDVERFHSQFEWAVAELSADIFRDVHGYSRDEMIELGAWIASQGRDYYARVYDHPRELPRWADFDEATQLDGVATEVHEERFGESPPYTA